MTRTALILDQVARNLIMTIPAVARWRARRGRTAISAATIDTDYLARYAFDPFALLGRITDDGGVAGRVVGEIGPGDHMPVAILALAAGARGYVAYDRFPGDVAGGEACRVYAALIDSLERDHPSLARRLNRRGIRADDFPGAYPELVRRVVGPFERVTPDDEPTLDALLSYNVVEHIEDLDGFAAVSRALLRPGGAAVHRVDLGPHGAWLGRRDEFEWLTPSERLWRWMGSRRGVPSRARYHEVVRALRSAGFRVEEDVLERYSESSVEAARPRLAPRFKAAPLDSLVVKSVIIECRRGAE